MSKPDLLKFSGSQAENAALAAISHPKYKKLKCTSLIGLKGFTSKRNYKDYAKFCTWDTERPSTRSREDDYFEIDTSLDSYNQSNEPRTKAQLIVTFFDRRQ